MSVLPTAGATARPWASDATLLFDTMTANTRPPHQWTAVETLAELAARRISAVELLEHYINRRNALDSGINAVVATDHEGAMRAARDIDARRASGAPLPP